PGRENTLAHIPMASETFREVHADIVEINLRCLTDRIPELEPWWESFLIATREEVSEDNRECERAAATLAQRTAKCCQSADSLVCDVALHCIVVVPHQFRHDAVLFTAAHDPAHRCEIADDAIDFRMHRQALPRRHHHAERRVLRPFP